MDTLQKVVREKPYKVSGVHLISDVLGSGGLSHANCPWKIQDKHVHLTLPTSRRECKAWDAH